MTDLSALEAKVLFMEGVIQTKDLTIEKLRIEVNTLERVVKILAKEGSDCCG